MFNMKRLVQIACTAALISASSYSYAAQNGINYDPLTVKLTTSHNTITTGLTG